VFVNLTLLNPQFIAASGLMCIHCIHKFFGEWDLPAVAAVASIAHCDLKWSHGGGWVLEKGDLIKRGILWERGGN
jgi:hypothetical protein